MGAKRQRDIEEALFGSPNGLLTIMVLIVYAALWITLWIIQQVWILVRLAHARYTGNRDRRGRHRA